MAMPGFDYDAPEYPPVRSLLYDAATVIPSTGLNPRIGEGVRVWPTNCGPTGTWPSDPCAVIAPGTRKGGSRPAPSDLFDPVTMWAWDECGAMLTTPEAARARAQHLLDIDEPRLVESAFGAVILADAGAAGASVSIVDAVAQLEAALLAASVPGVIHANPYWTTVAFSLNLIERSGGVIRTKRGTAWADGGGYVGALDDTLVATGPVYIWRGEITVRDVAEPTINLEMALAERQVLAAYDPCFTPVAVTVPALVAGTGGD